MVASAFSAVFASIFYLYSISFLVRRIQANKTDAFKKKIVGGATAASMLHFLSFSPFLITAEGMTFGLGIAISLITWGAVVSLIIINVNQNTGILGIFIFPLALLSTPLAFVGQTEVLPYQIGTHILISIVAYSVLALAAAQAILYSIQEKRFQKRQITNLFRALPPLQVMERILVQMIVIGFIVLTLALVTGAIFIEDMFAQHLIHKTFFALLSWLTYGLFLFGHYKKGWRGQTAAKYTLWAFGFLILSYLGTQSIMLLLGK